jgi:hypothetical protein
MQSESPLSPLSPMPMHLSTRCGARTRNATACQSGAMANGRCRMHGGQSPGAPLARNALSSGRYTAEMLAIRKQVAFLRRMAREAAGNLRDDCRDTALFPDVDR